MKYSEEVRTAILSEDFYETNEVLAKVREEADSFEYVSFILRLMEENPNLDFGVPGPAVHFVEKFFQKGYEELLLESVNRRPTIHTLWMLNRIINSPALKDKEKYLSALKSISENENELDSVREEARSFLSFQNNK